jgi:excisionase family DNA binding protein
MMNMPTPGSRFNFMDVGEVTRRLKIDRLTLDQWIRDGRIKAVRGTGKDVFFRTAEVEALYKELHPEATVADESANVAAASAQPMQLGVRKKQDAQMRVYQRLLADAKWFDISDADIREWARQLAPDGFDRNKKNALHAIQKLQYAVTLIEEAQEKM